MSHIPPNAQRNLIETLAAIVIREQELHGLDGVFISLPELEEVRRRMKAGKTLVVDTESAPGMTRVTLMTEDDADRLMDRLEAADQCL